jgi:DNA segregation ATPase FtsK/SpoIIIE-like protein
LPGNHELQRVHGAYVSEVEIHALLDLLRIQRAPEVWRSRAARVPAAVACYGSDDRSGTPTDDRDPAREPGSVQPGSMRDAGTTEATSESINILHASRIRDIVNLGALFDNASRLMRWSRRAEDHKLSQSCGFSRGWRDPSLACACSERRGSASAGVVAERVS